MKKEIKLAWTRDFTLAWAEWWSVHMNPRLIEVFGTGVPNQLSVYNGRLLETYRLTKESKAFIKAVANSKLSVLSEQRIKRYIFLTKQIRKLLQNANKDKNFKDHGRFKKLKIYVAEMYPWYTASYLLPQDQWAPEIHKKYPKQAKEILKRLIHARHVSEGVIEELVEYWRSIGHELLQKRNLSTKYSAFITFKELEKMLTDQTFSPNRKELHSRLKGYIFFGKAVFTGVSRETFFKKKGFEYLPEKGTTHNQIVGSVSSRGPASIKGTVSIILKNEEINNFKPGNILVTVMTNPFFVPIMKKAKAVITDEGGITCHAAIVYRELKIPCITGTKLASKLLKDGDRVEVDANKGIVRKIK